MATINTVEQVVNALKNGNVAVVPTDTLYGIVVLAKNKDAVKKLYKIKQRDNNKPCIILINDISQIDQFNIKINNEKEEFLNNIWPGPVSVILSCNDKKFTYLHKGLNSIAFRLISKKSRNLYNIISQTGPLLAPSANPQGQEPATCVYGARRYFGTNVDAYLCGGTRKNKASTIVDYTNDKYKIIRQGDFKIK